MVLRMDRPGEGKVSSWEDLSRALDGSFTARARGLVSPGLTLFASGNEPFGRFLTDASGTTRFQAGDLEAEIRQDTDHGFVMTTGDAWTLTAKPAGPPTVLGVTSGDRAYEARISLFRNRATARSSTGGETVRLSGGLTNRRYRADFDPQDPAALPIAVFLLHHTNRLRSGAYRTA